MCSAKGVQKKTNFSSESRAVECLEDVTLRRATTRICATTCLKSMMMIEVHTHLQDELILVRVMVKNNTSQKLWQEAQLRYVD